MTISNVSTCSEDLIYLHMVPLILFTSVELCELDLWVLFEHCPPSSPQNSSQLAEVVKKWQKTPYILATGHAQQLQTFLVVDKSVVCECPLEDITIILISAFFLLIYVILQAAIMLFLFWSMYF